MIVPLVLGCLVSLGATSPGGLTGGPRPSRPCAQWEITPTPALDQTFLLGVSGTGPADAWAVGGHDYGPSSPVILRWDGETWISVTAGGAGVLFAVHAIAPDDAWAVGRSDLANQALIEHWDGTTWSLVPGPTPGQSGALYGVSAASSTDVWAVGYYMDDTGYNHLLVEHWDGVSWNLATAEEPSALANVFDAVSVLSTDDAWAVGWDEVYFPRLETLIEHWDGTSWTVVPSPPPPSERNPALYGVAAVATDDVWAVGVADRTLIEHWDGTSWQLVRAPQADGAFLYAVSAGEPSQVWAVGNQNREGIARPLTERWTGSSWKAVQAPNPGGAGFTSVAIVSPHDVWAVGGYAGTPLIEHGDDECP